MNRNQIRCSVGTCHSFLYERNTNTKDIEGLVWVFGSNNYGISFFFFRSINMFTGQLGVGDSRDRTTPTTVTLPNNKRVKDIVCGNYHTHFLTLDGLLYSIGCNKYGQLGIGRYTTKTLNVIFPVIVEFPHKKKIKKVFCSGNSGHTFALTTDELWFCFGMNSFGQLGIGNITFKNTPVLFTQPIGVKVVYVATGGEHTLFLTDTQKVYSCGSNYFGQLSTGSIKEELKPVLCCFELQKKIQKICAGSHHSLFLSSDFDVLSCGYGKYGMLGHNTKERVLTAKIIKSLSNQKVINIDCGSQQSVFYTGDGDVFVCGWNYCGNLGLKNTQESSILVPTHVNFFSKINQFCCGCDHSVIVTDDGLVYSSGCNKNGYLGIGKNNKEVEQLNEFTKVDIKWNYDIRQRSERWEYLFGCV